MAEHAVAPGRYATITLGPGMHSSAGQGMCLMEAAAYLARERHSDHPRCVSPVLGTFGRYMNDVLPHAQRQLMVALIPGLLETVDDGADEARGYMALDWLIRTWLPSWLDLTPACRPDAVLLWELGRIDDLVSAAQAGRVVARAQRNAAAAGAAAGVAAWDAGGFTMGDVAWAAPRAAAQAATESGAWDAARGAAEAAGQLGGGLAAGDAVWDAARAAASAAAWSAPRCGAVDALAPTVRMLQESALNLFADMITVSSGAGEVASESAERVADEGLAPSLGSGSGVLVGSECR